MSSFASALRTRNPRVLGGGVVLLVVLVLLAVVVAGRGEGDDELRIVRGAPATGFPLRGDGARDTGLIRSAAKAWVRSARRGDDDWVGHGRVDVTALWAGRVSPDTDAVVLASDREAAVLRRLRGREYWQISEAVVDEAEDPVLVASGGEVLVREGTDASFRASVAAGRNDAQVRLDAGLWHRDSGSLPDGTLTLPDGLRSRFSSASADRPAVGVFFGGVPGGSGAVPALRELSPALLRRLDSGPDAVPSPGAQRLVAAASLAGTTAGDDARPQRPSALPRLDLLAVRSLPPLGPVVVVSATPSLVAGRSENRRPALVAAAGGSTVAARRYGATAIALGGADNPQRADDGPALGAAYVQRATRTDDPDTTTDDESDPRVDGPYLLVAADDRVAGVEVRAGRRSSALTPPVGLIPAPWARAPEARERGTTDVAVLGRTARGALVVPEWPGADVASVLFRD
ncbi:hypothetical protein AB0L40_09040 [Patulibacter sp. NPDC049589]|uniref:hypothetical protein n=1 Tax=Patulibacter sp. NPDC049589 TaxID=3154731 RepID=UPI0034383B78